MGFFTGFFSGFAFTTSVLYITLQVHCSTRLDQKAAIRDQTRIIEWLASSRGAYDRRLLPRDDEACPHSEGTLTPSRSGVKGQLKHRWNEEVRSLARKAYNAQWEDVRDTAVDGWKGMTRFVKGE
ncbi:hypothetical protein BDV10DRAFT_164541 [Aspergillus recurvatus]